MAEVFRTVEEVTSAALTDILQRAGRLQSGRVQAITSQGNAAFNSTVAHLNVHYSADAPEAAPRTILYKRNIDAEWAQAAGAREVAFYQSVTSFGASLPMIVPCFDAVYDPVTGDSHLLLLDVSATHHAPLSRRGVIEGLIPHERDLDGVIDSLAQFHAAWWEHPRLGSGDLAIGEWCKDWEHFHHEILRREAAWADLLAGEQSWLPAAVQEQYAAALAGLPAIWRRYIEPRMASLQGLTLTHGDAYFSNFLCPNSGIVGLTYLIDWQSPTVWRGADDLVTMLATFWNSAQRADGRREEQCLRRYYDGLVAHGVQQYAWDDLLRDYRLGILEWLCVPVQDRVDGSPQEYWWPKLQNLLSAYHDHHVSELL